MNIPTDMDRAPADGGRVNGIPRFQPEKTIEQMMGDQGIYGPQDIDALFGGGVDLWENDEEFEAFQQWLRQARSEGR